MFAKTVREAKRGTAADLAGWAYEHLHLLSGARGHLQVGGGGRPRCARQAERALLRLVGAELAHAFAEEG
eukprot:9164663-Alexandrium_andersonii.AAC.1